MSTLEHQIVARVRQLDKEQQQRVLDFIAYLEAPLSARQLMQLPPEERQRRVAAAFARAADVDFETFEAYSEEPLDE